MSALNQVLDEAMNLSTEQQEMLIQILQRRAISSFKTLIERSLLAKQPDRRAIAFITVSVRSH
jgi:hypothetical protein